MNELRELHLALLETDLLLPRMMFGVSVLLLLVSWVFSAYYAFRMFKEYMEVKRNANNSTK